MALVGGLAAFLFTMGAWRPGPAAMVGAVLPVLALAVAGQALAPTAAYVVVLPVLLAAGAMAAVGAAASDSGIMARIVAVFAAALVGGYMIALGHQIMQGVGPGMPVAAVLPLAVAAMAVLPLWPGLGVKTARVVAALLLVLAAGVALDVRLDSLADTVPVYSADK